jgi:HPt (histidine-containing phosphotransfer) domain-containing protein
MEFDISFLKEKGIDTDAGLEYTGGQEKYISALRRFYKGFDDGRTKLEGYLGAGDMDNYKVVVHALKSNAKMLGAMELSKGFESLEEASARGDISFVRVNSPQIMREYEELVLLLGPVGEADIEPPADEIDADRAKEIVTALLEALDDFDDEKSTELSKQLMGYPFRITQREKLELAIKHISDFLYDDAADLIKEIAGTIE